MDYRSTIRYRGFTLAELLIAILIFSVVISLTYAAFNATFTSVDSGEAGLRFGEPARITLERITEDLESFYGGENSFFRGESERFADLRGDSLRFTSRAHLRFNRNQRVRGVTIISYSVEEVEESGELRLFRHDQPVLPGVDANNEKGFLLCEGLRELKFTYIDDEGEESESWDSSPAQEGEEAEYPTLVRIYLGFSGEGNDGEDDEEPISYITAIALPSSR